MAKQLTGDNPSQDQKLSAYHLEFEQGTYRREYAGFPTILFVTTDDAAEERIIAAARVVAVGRPDRLPLLITTEVALTKNARGLRGWIWRTVSGSALGRWPGLS